MSIFNFHHLIESKTVDWENNSAFLLEDFGNFLKYISKVSSLKSDHIVSVSSLNLYTHFWLEANHLKFSGTYFEDTCLILVNKSVNEFSCGYLGDTTLLLWTYIFYGLWQ